MGQTAADRLVIVGSILLVLALLAFAIPRFNTQHTEEVARIGDLRLQTTERTPHVIPPIVSGGALVLGIVLIGAGLYRRR